MKKYIILLLFAFIGACANGSPPVISESHVLTQRNEKVQSLRFFYRNANMVRTTSGRGPNGYMADVGIKAFGMILVERAESAFAKSRIAVVESKVLEANDVISDDSVHGAGGVKLPILIIIPMRGSAQLTGNTRTSHGVFSALLIDPELKKTIWKATIETNTSPKIIYDENYADQFFDLLIKKMREDSVI